MIFKTKIGKTVKKPWIEIGITTGQGTIIFPASWQLKARNHNFLWKINATGSPQNKQISKNTGTTTITRPNSLLLPLIKVKGAKLRQSCDSFCVYNLQETSFVCTIIIDNFFKCTIAYDNLNLYYCNWKFFSSQLQWTTFVCNFV